MIDLTDLLNATGGRLHGPAQARRFSSFLYDSRLLAPSGDQGSASPGSAPIFVAVKSEKGDGHDYIGDAIARGASGVLCQQPFDEAAHGVTCVVVADTRAALTAYARHILQRPNLTTVGITGSAGKSTAKELIAAVLSQSGRPVFRNRGSINGRYGLSIAAGELEPQHELAVLELAADSFDEIRATHAQNLVLPHVRKADLYAVWQALDAAGLANVNLDLVTDIIACPGLDYCSLANARSIPVAQKIAARFADLGRQKELGELKLKISGCINACGHHHAGHIGILGVDRKGTENYQLLLGGSGAEDVSLGTITGPGFDEDGIVDAIERVTDRYLAERAEGERFVDTFRRVGMAPFKEAIYG